MANMKIGRQEMPVQDPAIRCHNFEEVATGYTREQALNEASRCLQCKNKPCVGSCPVAIDIPGFIKEVQTLGRRIDCITAISFHQNVLI